MAIADGIGDRPNAELKDLTPLQYAETPNLDYISRNGVSGIMDLVRPGVPVGTDMGHLILFGYDAKDYPGRGPIEALGVQVDLEPGDVVFRCNFATIDEKGIVLDRRAQRIREGTEQLAASLNGMDLGNGITAYFKAATEHRAVLILRGENLSADISDTDPLAPNDGKKYRLAIPTKEYADAKRTAEAINHFLEKAHDILKHHKINKERESQGLLPANFILTRGSGILKNLPSIYEKKGIRSSCIAGEGTVLGVAKLAGYERVTDVSFTGNLDTNYHLKAKCALKESKAMDITYVHLKAPDIYGHDNKPLKKVEAIELFDKLVGRLLEDLGEDTYIVLAADHSTPCEIGEHTGEPVPVAIYGPNLRVDHVEKYNEIDCAHGGLGRLTGSDFISTLYDLMGFSKKLGS